MLYYTNVYVGRVVEYVSRKFNTEANLKAVFPALTKCKDAEEAGEWAKKQLRGIDGWMSTLTFVYILHIALIS